MLILLSLLVFGLTVSLVLGLNGIFTLSSKEVIRQRMKDFVLRPSQPRKIRKKTAPRRRDLFPLLTQFITEKGFFRELNKKLAKSGFPLRVSEFLYLDVFITILSFFLVFFFAGNQLLALVFALIVFFLPFRYLKVYQQRRIVKFNDYLPNFLNVIANSLKSGFGFTQSIEIAIKDTPVLISQEFRRVLQEIDRGLSLEGALENLRERIPCENLNLVIAAILIQTETGGSLSKVLETLVFTIRERIRIQKEIKVLTAQGRMSGLIVGVMPLVMGLIFYLLNPEYLKPLFTTSLGQLMLGMAVLMEIMGVLVIRSIIRVKF